MRIAVIIPFYQRETGILTRALRSVVAQVLPAGIEVEIVVIDDQSPVSVETEVADLPIAPPFSLHLISQPNGGPAAARNAGLEQVATRDDIDFVAFLDSDDEWASAHLREAILVLERHDYDFYFCDCVRPGVFDRFSNESATTRNQGSSLAERGMTLHRDPTLRGFASHELDGDFLARPLCHTSTVVIRACRLRTLRFDQGLTSAGEDWLYWIEVLRDGARPIISWACNVTCGRGVNIFFDAFDWNAAATLDRIGCYLLLAHKLQRLDPPPSGGQASMRRFAERYRRAYCFLFVRTLLRLHAPHLSLLRRLMRFDPILPLRMPWLFLVVAFDRRPESRQW